jgi:hypothetical protein
MSERSQKFMEVVWDARNSGADTEEKLVAAILKTAAEVIVNYQTQNDIIVIDKTDMLQLAKELEE